MHKYHTIIDVDELARSGDLWQVFLFKLIKQPRTAVETKQMTYIINIQDLVVAGLRILIIGRNNKLMTGCECKLDGYGHRSEEISIIICQCA